MVSSEIKNNFTNVGIRKMMKDPIRVFVTGGTFDKDYNYITGELYFKESHLEEMFIRGRSTLEIEVEKLFMMDSLELKDQHRQHILEKCKSAVEENMVITHGTDTMVETAKVLALANLREKTIILTGAMVPYAFGTSSDGFFNLGASLAYAKVLEPGVYICMNGQYFQWDNVKKNKETGFFETLS